MSSDQVFSARAFFWLALAVVIGVLIYLLSPILTLFLLAAIWLTWATRWWIGWGPNKFLVHSVS